MRSPRAWFFALLLGLPSAIVVASGSWLIVSTVPRLTRAEPQRVGRAYRSMAEELKENPDHATYIGPRKRGWRQAGKLSGVPYGYVESGDKVEIWYKSAAREWRSITTDAVERVNYELIFYGGGALVLLLIALLTVGIELLFLRFAREHDDFLAATAHDLTTPLVGMRMTIGRDDEEAKLLNERMLRIVANIRDFLKLHGRRPAPKLEPLDLVKAYDEAYALFRTDYRDCLDGQDVPVEGADAPMLVHADATMTVQILWNLLGNDLKYAAPHGGVRVVFARKGNRVEIRLVDDGQGMTPRQMRHVFDRYYRAKTARESGKGGFGIGLCTAREFARAMGGELTVAANRPHGCIFTLSLPAI